MKKNLNILVVMLVILVFTMSACNPTTTVPTPETNVTPITGATVATPTPQPTIDPYAEPVTLRMTIWTSVEAQLATLNEVAQDFKLLHPNVTVEFVSIPYADYAQKVTIQLAGGDHPDAGWLDENKAMEWIDAGVLADLKPAIDSFEGYDYADLSKSVQSTWERGNLVYGVTFSASPEFITYNKDLFDNAGIPSPDEMLANGDWTWANLAIAAKQITEGNPSGTYGFMGMDGVLYTTQPWWTVIPIMRSYGGDAWSTDGKQCLLNSAGSVQGMQLLHKMIFEDKSVVPPGETIAFNSGRIGMVIHRLSSITREMPDATFKWGIVPLPAGPTEAAQVLGEGTLVAFNASNHIEIAKDLIAFMSSKESFQKFARFWPPQRKSVQATDVLAEGNPLIDPVQLKAAVSDSISIGYVLPMHTDFAKLELLLRVELANLWKPEANAQVVLDAACTAGASYFK